MIKYLIMIGVFTLSGCISMHPKSGLTMEQYDELSKRAAFDFSCDAANLDIQKLSGALQSPTAGVKGCNKKATYIRVIAYPGFQWVMNTTSAP